MKTLATILALLPAPAFADVAQLANWWTGNFSSGAQVAANSVSGQPDVPELTRTLRQMTIERVIAPQLGQTGLSFHEHKAPDMAVASRARAYVNKDLPDGRVRAVQHFSRVGPTYNRKSVTAAAVPAMQSGDFTLAPRCDLFFAFNAGTGRYEGGMSPRTCVYEHAVDGFVYAESDQFIRPTETLYRDRSIKIATGGVRGSIEGFAFPRFGKTP